jgi:hypothetical protein
MNRGMIDWRLFTAYWSTWHLIQVEIEQDAEYLTDDDHMVLRKGINENTTVSAHAADEE